MAQNGNFMVEVKPWYVVGSTDDNPDITKYMGYYQLKVGYQLGDAVLSAKGQYNWNTGYGGAELGLSYPVTKHVRLYTQVYSGYGESLIRLQLQPDPCRCGRHAERYFLSCSNVFALNVEVSLSGAENSACFISGIWG